jgi:hypothetical protein
MKCLVKLLFIPSVEYVQTYSEAIVAGRQCIHNEWGANELRHVTAFHAEIVDIYLLNMVSYLSVLELLMYDSRFAFLPSHMMFSLFFFHLDAVIKFSSTYFRADF